MSYQAVAYHRAAREREAAAARLRADLAEAKLTAIEGQLHPHFLFNALNSIAALVRFDPPQAEVMLEQLSELLRAMLRTNPMREVPLRDALHLSEQYLAIEHVRFQTRLRSTIIATDAARRARVPQLIVQPLIENAVRHGIAPVEAGGNVTVSARVDGNTLVLVVEDDGVGFGNAPPELTGAGLGLRSVRSVLSHLYGETQRFDVRTRSPSGTMVRIELPYRPVSE
jgi:two-component system, LytTR family, sensor kinase